MVRIRGIYMDVKFSVVRIEVVKIRSARFQSYGMINIAIYNN